MKIKRDSIIVPIRTDIKEISKIKFTKYDIDKILKEESERSFGHIDYLSRIILGTIARHGSLNETKIEKLGFRKSHYITRDTVRYRLYNKKNRWNLLRNGFVIQKKGESIGNIKNKNEQKYYLTLRGFLASLSLCKFDDCYLVKKYKDIIPDSMSNYHISTFIIQLIKYQLALFFLKNMITGMSLTFVDLYDEIHSFIENDPLTNPNFEIISNHPSIDDIIAETRFWFYIYSQLLDICLKKSTRYKPKQKENEMYDNLRSYVVYWQEWMIRSQFQKNKDFVPKVLPDEIEVEFVREKHVSVDVKNANIVIKKVLKKFGMKPSSIATKSSNFFKST